jgi:hypothetical protein
MTLDEFKLEILTAKQNKPDYIRDGQFVFNYINANYGVARTVQFMRNIDCFYDNSQIDSFIENSFDVLQKKLQENG